MYMKTFRKKSDSFLTIYSRQGYYFILIPSTFVVFIFLRIKLVQLNSETRFIIRCFDEALNLPLFISAYKSPSDLKISIFKTKYRSLFLTNTQHISSHFRDFVLDAYAYKFLKLYLL
jgi:hypothetical protein